jgi:hypothetical protein
MTKSTYHLQEQEIPEGFQIFADRLEVAGVSFRKGDATAFASSKDGWLEFEREPGNRQDKNAIRIIGCSKGFFGTKRRFIGYVPKEFAKMIVEGGFWERVRPRLLKTYVGDSGFVEVLFQILGPKGQKYQFDPPKSQEGDHYTAYVERVKQLKVEDKYDEAIELLLKLVDGTEKEARGHGNGWGVAPWYYEQLAIIYRKKKRYDDEVQILERYENQPKAPGAGPGKLAERLLKAKQLRGTQRA